MTRSALPLALVPVLGAGVLVLADAGAYARVGVPEPGAVFRFAVAALRAVAELGGGLAGGLLLVATVVCAPQRSGVLDVEGWLAARRAAVAAAAAGTAALLLGPLTASDLSGVPVAQVALRFDLYGALEEPLAWLVAAAALLGCAAGCAGVLRWGWLPLLGGVAVLGVVASAVVGPAVTGADHDRTTDAAVLSAVGSLAIGVLAGLVTHRGRDRSHPAAVRRRALLLAAGLVALLLAGTVVRTVVLLGDPPVVATAWGIVAVVRLAVLAAVLVVALLVLAAPVVVAVWGPRVALAAVVVVVALGAAQARWVPPRFLTRSDTPGETLIGYDLPDPVGPGTLLTEWRFNTLFGTAAVGLAALYLLGARRLRDRGDAWPPGRTTAFLLGCALLLITTSSGVGAYATAVFSVHMVAHMVLTMLVPVLWAMGGPVTLVLRALPAAHRDDPPGAREWVAALVSSRWARVATHPLLALAVFVGSLYAVYLTGLFDLTLRYHWAHQVLTLHFLLTGYAFFWPVVGVDPSPARLPHLGRLGVLLAAMPFHAFFGVVVMNSRTVPGGEFYRSLALPWLPDLLADQRLGGGIAWAAGEVPMLLVAIVLLTRWARDDEREAARHDRRADRDGDGDLEAYNAMLARLAGDAR